MKIKIFESEKEINLESFIDSRALVCANSGGGKSYLVRKILEETSKKVMSIVLDVEGEFKTLREKYDFLLIGNNADVPLSLKSAGLLPKKLLELNVSTIIDISDLKMGERIQYVKYFLQSLMELPRELWKPCIVVLDEAHLLAGQQEKQDSTHAVIDLMTRGRKRGFCGILATQRISKLHKDAVAEANNYLVGRTGLDIDMKRASEILGFTDKKDMLSLRDLDPGEFYVFGPAISKHVEKEKVGEVKTTHPKVGMDIKGKIVEPTDEIRKILTKISELPKELEKEAKTTKEMQSKIKELQHELRILKHSKPKPEIDEKMLEKAKHAGFKESEKQYINYIKLMENQIRMIRKKLLDIGRIVGQEVKPVSVPIIKPMSIPFKEIAPSTFENNEVKPSVSKELHKTSDESGIKLNFCAKKIYSLLYENSEKDFTRSQIAVLTGYSLRSSGFINALSQLNVQSLIKKIGDRFTIREVNSELATENIGELSIDMFVNKLPKCPRDIFKFLLDNPEEEFSKEEIAEKTGYSATSSGFINSLSKLNVLELITRENQMIKLNSDLLEIQ